MKGRLKGVVKTKFKGFRGSHVKADIFCAVSVGRQFPHRDRLCLITRKIFLTFRADMDWSRW